MKIKPKLIIGLGNPLKEYQNTYHNVGVLFIDYLNSKSRIHICPAAGHPNLQILKSEAYMNESGRFLVKMAKKYKVKPEEILVVHDDLDMPLGRIKVVRAGGAGGHKGVSSIIQHLGSTEFCRVKVGIGAGESIGSLWAYGSVTGIYNAFLKVSREYARRMNWR